MCCAYVPARAHVCTFTHTPNPHVHSFRLRCVAIFHIYRYVCLSLRNGRMVSSWCKSQICLSTPPSVVRLSGIYPHRPWATVRVWSWMHNGEWLFAWKVHLKSSIETENSPGTAQNIFTPQLVSTPCVLGTEDSEISQALFPLCKSSDPRGGSRPYTCLQHYMGSILVELFGSRCSRDRGGHEPCRGAAGGFREEAGRALHCLLKALLAGCGQGHPPFSPRGFLVWEIMLPIPLAQRNLRSPLSP